MITVGPNKDFVAMSQSYIVQAQIARGELIQELIVKTNQAVEMTFEQEEQLRSYFATVLTAHLGRV